MRTTAMSVTGSAPTRSASTAPKPRPSTNTLSWSATRWWLVTTKPLSWMTKPVPLTARLSPSLSAARSEARVPAGRMARIPTTPDRTSRTMGAKLGMPCGRDPTSSPSEEGSVQTGDGACSGSSRPRNAPATRSAGPSTSHGQTAGVLRRPFTACAVYPDRGGRDRPPPSPWTVRSRAFFVCFAGARGFSSPRRTPLATQTQ